MIWAAHTTAALSLLTFAAEVKYSHFMTQSSNTPLGITRGAALSTERKCLVEHRLLLIKGELVEHDALCYCAFYYHCCTYSIHKACSHFKSYFRACSFSFCCPLPLALCPTVFVAHPVVQECQTSSSRWYKMAPTVNSFL